MTLSVGFLPENFAKGAFLEINKFGIITGMASGSMLAGIWLFIQADIPALVAGMSANFICMSAFSKLFQKN